ncbi:hypothetical protein AVEN_174883-1 [Araneus ventricosus]|uniref:Uncharacterized protein n=1 Tax=Araneus ventricosus TaxID=182803 RepID=A0A4Y2TPJ6_ARAVE|nr:hypothetical protein AVEN_174883-1 [Araneus ventricosus]
MTDVLILSEPLSYNELFTPAAEMVPAESCRAEKPSGGRRSKHRVGSSRPPSSLKQHKRAIQIYRHKEGLAVLCFRDRSYCLTNGMKSHVREHDGRYVASLMDQLREMNVTRLFVTDVTSQVRWELIARTLDERHPLKNVNVENLRERFWRLSDLQEELREVGGRLWNQLHQKSEGGHDTSQQVTCVKSLKTLGCGARQNFQSATKSFERKTSLKKKFVMMTSSSHRKSFTASTC